MLRILNALNMNTSGSHPPQGAHLCTSCALQPGMFSLPPYLPIHRAETHSNTQTQQPLTLGNSEVKSVLISHLVPTHSF